MSILNFIGDIFKPVADTIDELHTSEEEKLKAKNIINETQNELAAKVIEYESELAKQRAKVVEAEATGQSWLQRNWRPILMLSIVAIVVNNYLLAPYLGFVETLELPERMWTLMTVGVGGYIAGRSGEKIVHDVKQTPGGVSRKSE